MSVAFAELTFIVTPASSRGRAAFSELPTKGEEALSRVKPGTTAFIGSGADG